MKNYKITVNGVTYDVSVEEVGADSAPAQPSVQASAPAAAPVKPAQSAPQGAQGSVKVTAPMQGNVMKIKVKVGDSVKKGQTVAVLEAMKMENDIPSPADGVVASVNVSEGASVKSDDVILTLK
ncbi:MAG: biotin/lipoyl-binding protein [Clostridia bacterium]|nr:biotin/lipoyl-binding protein [Clostridia bacterium]